MQTLAFLEKFFAAAIGIACLLLLARQFIGSDRRARLDARVSRRFASVHRMGIRLFGWPAARREARRAAEDAIRRARGATADWDGNVARPKAFRKPRKLH